MRANSMSDVGRARKRWPRAIWIDGDGPFACASFCRPGVTVTLWQTRADAEIVQRGIDETGCGGGCCNAHKIIDLNTGRGRARRTRGN